MRSSIAKNLTVLILIASWSTLLAQKQRSNPEIRIPMEPRYWEYDTASIRFITHRDVKAAYVSNGAPLYLKDQTFSNGTIEYDVELGGGFPGIGFRMSSDWKNGDNFYLRYFGTTSPESRNTLQYTAMIDGTSIWDLSDEYQAGATLRIPGWNHVKLVISGKQMIAYVNDMSRPALIVPCLEGSETTGGLYFSGGQVTIANLVLKPDAVENLNPNAGVSLTYNDTRYLRHWSVTSPSDFPYGEEVVHSLPFMGGTPVTAELPDSTASWTPLAADHRGMVNLTRVFGGVKDNNRRLAWLKTTIQSDLAQERVMSLGFSDEIWVFINGQALYADKNHFGTPGQKFPRGRCTIENASVRLPLRQGDNEILIALTNYFYGWGMILRLDDMNGIHLPVNNN